MKQKGFHKKSLGYMGECYVKLELAKKGFFVSGVDHGFHFDLLCENGAKIDVKAALPSKNRTFLNRKWYTYKNWQFRISHPKQIEVNDFIVGVIFDNLESSPLGYFIFPIEYIKKFRKKGQLNIYESDIAGKSKKKNKKDLYQYLNNWNLIIKGKKRHKTII